MKNITKIVAAAAVAAVLTQSVQATPITGVIGFSGTATLNQPTASASTQVVSWGANNIGLHSGTFSGLTSAASVLLYSPWNFTSGGIANFWTVTDGTKVYTFNLSSSSVFGTTSGNDIFGNFVTSITIVLAGTVYSNVLGQDSNNFSGSMTIQDPSVGAGDGLFTYTESLSFNSVPDGGTTALLLGSALSGLALLRRKLVA